MKNPGIGPQEQCFGPVRFIPGPNRGRYPFCHSVYIEGAGVLIDPGGDRERLQNLRDTMGVSMVWLSHWHEDHWGHLDLFSDVPLWMSRQDAPALSSVDAFFQAYGMDGPQDARAREQFYPVLLEQFHFAPRTSARYLEPGQTLSLGSIQVQVIHAPGHTPGNMAFYFPNTGVLFLGDYDLTPFGPWYGDTGSSLADTIASVEKLRSIKARAWLTGHETGVFTSPPGALWEDYLQVIARREKDLLRFLRQPSTMEEIVSAWIVYQRPREPVPLYRFGERAIMGKHLEQLLQQGKVVERDGVFQST